MSSPRTPPKSPVRVPARTSSPRVSPRVSPRAPPKSPERQPARVPSPRVSPRAPTRASPRPRRGGPADLTLDFLRFADIVVDTKIIPDTRNAKLVTVTFNLIVTGRSFDLARKITAAVRETMMMDTPFAFAIDMIDIYVNETGMLDNQIALQMGFIPLQLREGINPEEDTELIATPFEFGPEPPTDRWVVTTNDLPEHPAFIPYPDYEIVAIPTDKKLVFRAFVGKATKVQLDDGGDQNVVMPVRGTGRDHAKWSVVPFVVVETESLMDHPPQDEYVFPFEFEITDPHDPIAFLKTVIEVLAEKLPDLDHERRSTILM